MPKRTDIETILLIGSGPIVIGQACEFDYSGSQSARALMDEGYRVVLVNSNPATIMTDPLMADEVYLRPLTPSSIAQIAREEEPDAVLPTMGGQTGLNVAQDLKKDGFWDEEGIDVIGVDIDTVQITEDRQEFRTLMDDIGLDQSRSDTAKSLLEAKEITQELGGLPVVIRPSYTLGGSGGGIVWKEDEFEEMVTRGLELSPAHQVLIDECLFGWKEYELELLPRPQRQRHHHRLHRERDADGRAHRRLGNRRAAADADGQAVPADARRGDQGDELDRHLCGRGNIQFAFEPGTGRMIVIEINPRVSRSSALASKATGYPIAKVASKLAIGYTLDELPNEVTGDTSACFEPSLDYVVTKIPRFNFDKFEGVDEELTTQMKAVGEVMSIGRTFNESLQKAWQSLEIGYAGLGADRPDADRETVRERLTAPRWDNLLHVRHAFRYGASVEEVHDITQIDKWFLYQIKDLVALEEAVRSTPLREMDARFLREVKRAGFSDEQIAFLVPEDVTDREVRAHRTDEDVTPAYQLVDTCAGEFPAETPYYYSSYETVNESTVTDRPKVLILGSGPNRIGQGIEFDYCCVHGVKAAQEMGYEALMLNCNPETVSTDFDVADKLYFEPVFWERVQDVIDLEQPEGVILQLGGQTAIKLGERFEEDGIQVLGTSYSKMDLVEDRGKFTSILQKLDIPFPPYGVAHSVEEALETAGRLGYPTLIRPSYVLGGEGMRIAINEDEVAEYVGNVLETYPDNEILLDRFLEDAVELDVDAICDGDEVWIAGMMQHIEPAGVHSGDSTAVLPPFSA